MAKFVMRCPQCAKESRETYLSVSSGLFAKRKVECPNGHLIDVKTDRMAMRICTHCGNNVVYDQKKQDSAVCPVCHTKINTIENNAVTVQILCPQCGCTHNVAKNAARMECAVCGLEIDIQKEIGKKTMREKNAVSLIKYEGDNSFFVWKHPIEDFKYGSQLIVHESQEALFFLGGQTLDLFNAGTYSLTTENIPLLGKVAPVASGNETFHSEIYYVNKTVHTGIKWGTSSRIRFFDPVSGMHVSIGLSGQLNMKVIDSKRLILKLIGTTDLLSHNHNVDDADGGSKHIFQYIKSVIVTKTRTQFTNVIKEQGWSILEIDAYIEELAEGIKEKINAELDEYGIILPEFFISNVSTPEDSEDVKEREDYLRMKRQYGERYLRVKEEEIKESEAIAAQKRKIVEAQTEAQIKVIQSQGEAESKKLQGFAEAEIQKAQGYTGKDKLQFEVQKTFAENIGNTGSGAGSMIGDFVGIGVGMGVMSKIGNTVGMMLESPNMQNEKQSMEKGIVWNCKCGATEQEGKFCKECGSPKMEQRIGWNCECGALGQTGRFCSECGKQKPTQRMMWTCMCGATRQVGKFCNECGKPKPEEKQVWDCKCGATGQTGKFCNECGSQKQDKGGVIDEDR